MTALLLKSIMILSISSNMFMISNFVTGVNFTKLRPHPTGHFRLHHEYRTIKTVSLMKCLIQSRLDNNCRAVSYNERFRYCELNDESGIFDVVDSTNTDTGWKTYNVINETVGKDSGPCKSDWHYYEGSCYLFQINGDDNKKIWEDATDACADKGAGLVRIGSKDEDDFILAKFEELNSGTTDLFIFTAGTDQMDEGRWIWSGRSGTISETMQYRKWKGDEPNNLEGNENCLALWPIHKGWFDITCSGRNYYICEA